MGQIFYCGYQSVENLLYTAIFKQMDNVVEALHCSFYGIHNFADDFVVDVNKVLKATDSKVLHKFHNYQRLQVKVKDKEKNKGKIKRENNKKINFIGRPNQQSLITKLFDLQSFKISLRNASLSLL